MLKDVILLIILFFIVVCCLGEAVKGSQKLEQHKDPGTVIKQIAYEACIQGVIFQGEELKDLQVFTESMAYRLKAKCLDYAKKTAND